MESKIKIMVKIAIILILAMASFAPYFNFTVDAANMETRRRMEKNL